MKMMTEEEKAYFLDFSSKMKKNTKKDYLDKLNELKQYIKKDLKNLKIEEAKDYFEEIEDKYAKSTREKIYSYFHSFYQYLLDKDLILENPLEKIEKTRVTREKNRDSVMSISEVKYLLDELEKISIRDRAIIETLIFTGCIVSEIPEIRWSDLEVDEKQNYFISLGRLRRRRILKVKKRLFDTYEKYALMLGFNPVFEQREDRLFAGQGRKSITDRTVRIIVKKVMKSIKLEKYSARDLRHTFAALALYAGTPEEEVSRQLGWSAKNYGIRYKYVLNLIDDTSID